MLLAGKFNKTKIGRKSNRKTVRHIRKNKPKMSIFSQKKRPNCLWQ